MRDTDYPYFPTSDADSATPPNFSPSPLANLGGLTHCFLAMPAKKRARALVYLLFSRLNAARSTRVLKRRALSRGESQGGILG